MKNVIINENQRGLLFVDGKFRGLLAPGKHIAGSTIFSRREIEVLGICDEISPSMTTLRELMRDKNTADKAVLVKVPDGHAALHFIDGCLDKMIDSGRHAFWKDAGEHNFKLVDLSVPEIDKSFDKYLDKIPADRYMAFSVQNNELGKLFIDNSPVRTLNPGVYRFWVTPKQIRVETADLRVTEQVVSGQELLTADKIGIRVTFVYNTKITDFEKFSASGNSLDPLYTHAQLALRAFISEKTLDEILDDRSALADATAEALKAPADEIGVQITSSGVKDIILPGDVKAILNEVLLAGKRAEANVITRREEVASTRSLLNTAKLMDENQTLYKLKELEYVQKICEQVGNISISNQGDILSQLQNLIKP